jgi:hypothetical protein
MTGTNCDLFTHNQSRSYLNHIVHKNMNNAVRRRVVVNFDFTLVYLA